MIALKKVKQELLTKKKNRETERKRALENLRMPKVQEIFTTVAIVYHRYERLAVSQNFLRCHSALRANVCNFRESVDSREFLNFFIFCSNNLYSTLISKITLKLVSAFYFFRNQAKFEKL